MTFVKVTDNNDNKNIEESCNLSDYIQMKLMSIGLSSINSYAIGSIISKITEVEKLYFASSEFDASNIPFWGQIDLLVIDLEIIRNDAAILERLTGRFQPIWSVVMTQSEEISHLSMMQVPKLDGCFSIAWHVEHLQEAFSRVLSGEKYFLDAVVSIPIKREGAAQGRLSKRQLEVLALVAQGKSNAEIANILQISTGTVNVHIHTIMKSIGANNRTGAAMIYRDQYAKF